MGQVTSHCVLTQVVDDEPFTSPLIITNLDSLVACLKLLEACSKRRQQVASVHNYQPTNNKEGAKYIQEQLAATTVACNGAVTPHTYDAVVAGVKLGKPAHAQQTDTTAMNMYTVLAVLCDGTVVAAKHAPELRARYLMAASQPY
jgi:hypothetical protein